MKKIAAVVSFLLAASTLVAACAPAQPATPEAAEEKTLYIGPELADCVGVAPQKCMMVKESPDGEYQFFYDKIIGFDYEEGYEYEIVVQVEQVENPPADASSLKYTLVEVVSKTPVAAMPDTTQSAEDLEGKFWQLESFQNNAGETVAVLPGTQVTAEFADGQVSGTAGCNNYFGAYTFEDGSLTIGPLGSTMMACPEEGVMEQESDYLAAMQSTASYEVQEGKLYLKDSDGNVVVTMVESQPPALTSGTWDLLSYNNSQEAVVSVLAGSSITAVFAEDNKLSGSAGCNNYTTSYSVDADSIQIGAPATTRKMCAEPKGIMEQETLYLTALENATVYSIRGDMLELRDEDGALQAQYKLAEIPDLSGSSWTVTGYNNGQGGFTTPLAGSSLMVEFGQDGQLGGSAGCNSFSTSYVQDGSSLQISSPFAVTMMFCSEPEGVMEQEAAFLAALEQVVTFSAQDVALELYAEDGTLMVSLRSEIEESVSTSPAVTEDAKTAAIELLKNFTYPSEITADGTAPLQNGEYRESAAPDSAAENVVQLLPPVSFGEIAGKQSAAVVLVTNSGGSGTFVDLVLVDLSGAVPVVLGSTQLGDRVRINSVEFKDDTILVSMVNQGPDDAMCCPTQWVEQQYGFNGSNLEMISEEVLGAADPNAVPLMGVEWHWVEFTSPVEQLEVTDPEDYTLRFLPDGQVVVQADCNRGSGTYTVSESSLDIEVMAMTMALCPDGSLSDQYVRYLNEAAIYFFEEGALFMDLPVDTGTMKFTW